MVLLTFRDADLKMAKIVMKKDVIAIEMKGAHGKDDFRKIEHRVKYEVK